MKQLLVCLILALAGANLCAQDRGLYWKYKDYDGAIALTVPRAIIHTGSWFLSDKADRKMLRKVRKARVLVFESGNNPISDVDVQRFKNKARKRRLEELVTVRSKETHVLVLGKERRNAIRKIVVLVREPETFALVSLRGKLRYDDLGKLINKLDFEGKNEGNDKSFFPENVRTVIRM